MGGAVALPSHIAEAVSPALGGSTSMEGHDLESSGM